ncbi:MAG TPA: hypothetical protein VEF53_07810 [Patescibacteria group bacterium]|nr:hypothetical protein [Patescibacteria group bacterium]
MNKRITIYILFILLISTALFFYFANANETVENEDDQLLNRVVEIERNRLLAQARSISFSDYKDRTSSFIHSYYRDAYFDELESAYKTHNIAELTKIPVYQYFSKVYTAANEKSKSIYVKIPFEGTTSQWGRLYIFKQEKKEWKIFSVRDHLLVIKRDDTKRIIEKFTNYDDVPIEYEYIEILELL